MDFLEKATDKLKVTDKLPDQVRNVLPGEGNKRGQGGHLAEGSKKTNDGDDGEGFPKGLRPSDWMGDLVEKNMFPGNARITQFRLPGSHDSCTYGSGLESFSYQCQEKNLYDQMMTGQRAFDVRLAKDDDHNKFIPVHGIAKNTANDFNKGPDKADKEDLSMQILRFAKEHPKEIIVLAVRVEKLGEVKDLFAEAVWNLLGNRLLEAPGEDGRAPTYEEAIRSNRNIVFGSGNTFPGKPLDKYVWKVGGNTLHWIGDGDQLLWNEPTWQSGEIKKVIHSTEEFMQKNEHRTGKRDKFWTAFCQLTPVLGQSISTFISEGGSVRPRDLALGGGLGTHGSFKGSNKELRESGVFKTPIWQKNASCVLYDFCDTNTTGAIVAMNIGVHAEGGNDGPGGFDDGPARGGRGGRGGGRGEGRGGGRGGRGDHEEGPGRREHEDEDHDGPGGGRGGQRGGRGRGEGRGEHRGEHRGGRGRGD